MGKTPKLRRSERMLFAVSPKVFRIRISPVRLSITNAPLYTIAGTETLRFFVTLEDVMKERAVA